MNCFRCTQFHCNFCGNFIARCFDDISEIKLSEKSVLSQYPGAHKLDVLVQVIDPPRAFQKMRIYVYVMWQIDVRERIAGLPEEWIAASFLGYRGLGAMSGQDYRLIRQCEKLVAYAGYQQVVTAVGRVSAADAQIK